MNKQATQAMSLFMPTRESCNWFVEAEGKTLELPEQALALLVAASEVQGATWWTAPDVSWNSIGSFILHDSGLKAIERQGFQLAPDAAFDIKPLPAMARMFESYSFNKADYIELRLEVAQRRYREVCTTWLGLTMPDPVRIPAYKAPRKASGEPTLKEFSGRLLFWLQSLGISAEDAMRVMADQRVAFSIKLQDGTGIVQELLTALWSVKDLHGNEVRSKLEDPGEQLMLMGYLNNDRNVFVPAR